MRTEAQIKDELNVKMRPVFAQFAKAFPSSVVQHLVGAEVSRIIAATGKFIRSSGMNTEQATAFLNVLGASFSSSAAQITSIDKEGGIAPGKEEQQLKDLEKIFKPRNEAA